MNSGQNPVGLYTTVISGVQQARLWMQNFLAWLATPWKFPLRPTPSGRICQWGWEENLPVWEGDAHASVFTAVHKGLGVPDTCPQKENRGPLGMTRQVYMSSWHVISRTVILKLPKGKITSSGSLLETGWTFYSAMCHLCIFTKTAFSAAFILIPWPTTCSELLLLHWSVSPTVSANPRPSLLRYHWPMAAPVWPREHKHIGSELSFEWDDSNAEIADSQPTEGSAGQGAVPLRDDYLFKQLVSTIPPVTINLFGKLRIKIPEVVERQMSDQLPGGSFWQPSLLLKEQAESCNISNISGEHVFGCHCVDSLLKRAPSVKPGKIESRTVFATNKTGEWLSNQPCADRDVRICCAWWAAALIHQDHHVQGKRYTEHLWEKIKVRRERKEAKAAWKRHTVEQHIDKVLQEGLILESQEVARKIQGKSGTNAKKL